MLVGPHYETWFISTLWRLEFLDDSWFLENLCTSCTDACGKHAVFIFFPDISNISWPFRSARKLVTSHPQTLNPQWYIRMGGIYNTHRAGKKSVQSSYGESWKESTGWGDLDVSGNRIVKWIVNICGMRVTGFNWLRTGHRDGSYSICTAFSRRTARLSFTSSVSKYGCKDMLRITLN